MVTRLLTTQTLLASTYPILIGKKDHISRKIEKRPKFNGCLFFSYRLRAKMSIKKDEVQSVIPIAKHKDLMNLAVLTGRQVSRPLKVFIVSQAGDVADVTLQCSCSSADQSVLKVIPCFRRRKIWTFFPRWSKVLFFHVWLSDRFDLLTDFRWKMYHFRVIIWRIFYVGRCNFSCKKQRNFRQKINLQL